MVDSYSAYPIGYQNTSGAVPNLGCDCSLVAPLSSQVIQHTAVLGCANLRGVLKECFMHFDLWFLSTPSYFLIPFYICRAAGIVWNTPSLFLPQCNAGIQACISQARWHYVCRGVHYICPITPGIGDRASCTRYLSSRYSTPLSHSSSNLCQASPYDRQTLVPRVLNLCPQWAEGISPLFILSLSILYSTLFLKLAHPPPHSPPFFF